MSSFNLTSSLAIIWAAGVGVSSSASTSGALMAKYCDQAEGVLCAATKTNWVTNLSSITAAYLGIIDDTVASIAAKKLVAYDTSGYNFPSEAQFITDVLSDNIGKNLSILQDIDVKKKMGV